MPIEPEAPSPSGNPRSAWVMPSVAAAVSACFLLLLAFEFRHGFDTTDEAFSILDASHPSDQTSAVRFHWLVTRPVLLLSLGDLWMNRVWGVVLLAAAGWLAGANLDRTRSSSDRGTRAVAGAVGGACMLAFFAFDLRSPGYNWAAVLGACLVVGCLAGAAASTRSGRWLMAGGAVAAVTAASKISTGASLATIGIVLSAIVAGRGWRASLRGMACWAMGVVGAGLLGVLMLRSWGDPIAAFQRGARVLEHIRLYDDLAGRTVRESLEFVEVWLEGAWPLLLAATIVGLASMAMARRWSKTVVALAPWSFPAVAFGMHFWMPSAWSKFDVWARVSLDAFTVVASTWLVVGGATLRAGELDRRGHLVRAALLIGSLGVPLATAVGTGNAMYWRSAGLASGVWLLAASALALGVGAGRRVNSSAQLASIAAASIVAFSTFSAMRAQPYRPLAGETADARRCEIAPGAGALIVDGRLATAIEELRARAAEAGFVAGDDVLALYDMPGVVLALGGRAPGASWILSGYRGCGPAAEVVLGSVSPERRNRAWVMLRSPQRAETWTRPGANPDVGEVLGAVGLDFPERYERVVEVPFPFYDQTATVSLWKPTGSTLGSP
jgi:hypothetical protein